MKIKREIKKKWQKSFKDCSVGISEEQKIVWHLEGKGDDVIIKMGGVN